LTCPSPATFPWTPAAVARVGSSLHCPKSNFPLLKAWRARGGEPPAEHRSGAKGGLSGAQAALLARVETQCKQKAMSGPLQWHGFNPCCAALGTVLETLIKGQHLGPD